jgi:hypothetical protein
VRLREAVVEITYMAQHNKPSPTGSWTPTAHIPRRDLDSHRLLPPEESIRSFALDRVFDMKERYLYFTVKEGFEPGEIPLPQLGTTTTRKSRGRPVLPAGRRLLLRKERWHPSEKREVLADGEVRLSFTVAGVEEIKRWIYSWLPNVRVIEPESLRNTIRKNSPAPSKIIPPEIFSCRMTYSCQWPAISLSQDRRQAGWGFRLSVL